MRKLSDTIVEIFEEHAIEADDEILSFVSKDVRKYPEGEAHARIQEHARKIRADWEEAYEPHNWQMLAYAQIGCAALDVTQEHWGISELP